jgi:hypothetical protein
MQRQPEALRRVREKWTRLPWLAAGFGHAVAQSLLDQDMVEQRQQDGRPTDWLVITVQGLRHSPIGERQNTPHRPRARLGQDRQSQARQSVAELECLHSKSIGVYCNDH